MGSQLAGYFDLGLIAILFDQELLLACEPKLYYGARGIQELGVRLLLDCRVLFLCLAVALRVAIHSRFSLGAANFLLLNG